MSGRQVLQSKYSGETRTYTFDFISVAGAVGNLASAVVTASVYSGIDASPSSVISGAATLATAPNKQVLQKLTGGVAGCIYIITCTATGASGEILVVEGLLAILPSP